MYRPVRSRSPSPSLPVSTKPTARYSAPQRRGWLSFIATSALFGILFHLVFLGFGGSRYVQQVPGLKDWIPPPVSSAACAVPALDDEDLAYAPSPAYTPIPAIDAPQTEEKTDDQQLLSVEEIGQIVGRTKGYLTRDYSLGLGWNNMRYIIEAALAQAELLNRTLVLPSFVYARSCEWEINSCAAFATMVNRGDAIGWGEWRDLPIEKQMGWRIPMSIMLDLPNLRTKRGHNVILIEEYLRYNGMNPGKEWSNGAWHRTDYLAPGMTIYEVKNGVYDPDGVVRVDDRSFLEKKTFIEYPGPHHNEHGGEEKRDQVSERLMAALGNQLVLEWPRVLAEVRSFVEDTRDFGEVEALLAKAGWAVIHTFAGALGMDYLKSVVEPIRQATPLSKIKGWVDDYGDRTEDILVIEGEIHLNRKPGGMRFTSTAARNKFADSVLHGLIPMERVRDLAEKVHDRMRERVGGRMWVAGHMRRGDFVDHGWAMEGSLDAHFDRIKNRLNNGKKVLQGIHETKDIKTYDVPNVAPDQSQILLDPPNADDPFFLATDERSADGIKYIKANGGILISDLLTIDDRRDFGWSIMVTDVLALVEQSVMARGYYFYAHAMSSVAGGAVNLRAARGVDPRTTLID